MRDQRCRTMAVCSATLQGAEAQQLQRDPWRALVIKDFNKETIRTVIAVLGGGRVSKRPRALITHGGYKLFNWIANSACAWTSTTVIYATNHANKQALTPVTSRAGARTPGLSVVFCLTHTHTRSQLSPGDNTWYVLRVLNTTSHYIWPNSINKSHTNSPSVGNQPHYPVNWKYFIITNKVKKNSLIKEVSWGKVRTDKFCPTLDFGANVFMSSFET